MLRRAKIVATLGPSSCSPDMLDVLFQAGVDVFRLNCSHTSDHGPNVSAIRALEVRHQRPTTILVDLQGPKWRIGEIAPQPVELIKGQTFILDQSPTPGDAMRAPFLHVDLYDVLNAGDKLRLDDGKIHLTIQEKTATQWITCVDRGGHLSSNKGVNIPYVDIPTSALTDKDYDDLKHALDWEVDWIALSFVQRPKDIQETRDFIQKNAPNSHRPLLMAKLEKPSAVQQLDDILSAADGIMIARGDLGVELPLEEVPPIQRQVITACRKAGKPVVVATQMLESMIHSPSPTRAEVSDVAHAVYDGADAVMLSGESAIGEFPVEAVTMMSRIIQSVERDPLYHDMMKKSLSVPQSNRCDALTIAARHVAATIPISALFSCTLTGATTLRAAHERPESPIIALTPSVAVARQLGIVWGVEAIWTKRTQDLSDMTEFICALARQKNLAADNTYIAILSGMPLWKIGGTSILRVELVTPHPHVNINTYLESYV